MAQVPAGKNRSGQLSKQTGDAWENQARRWLEGQGLRFIAANARERGGAIDLIMRAGTVTVEPVFRLPSSALKADFAAGFCGADIGTSRAAEGALHRCATLRIWARSRAVYSAALRSSPAAACAAVRWAS